MMKLQKKSFSAREETFALSLCGCACTCGCSESCDCPIAPTHQYGLNAQSQWKSKSTTFNIDLNNALTWAANAAG